MKKLTTILAIILLSSCSYVKEGDTIKHISTSSDEGYAIYTCNKLRFGLGDPTFRAPLGLYNIEDTIHFVKCKI